METNDQYNMQIKAIIEAHPKSWVVPLKKKENAHLLEYIYAFSCDFPLLPLGAKIYWALNDIHKYPNCANPNCSNKLTNKTACKPLYGYLMKYCSHGCMQRDPNYQAKLEKHMLEKFGYKSAAQNPSVAAKISKTKLSKTPEQKRKTNERREKTCMQKYGVKSVSQTQFHKDSVHETWEIKSDDEKLDIIQRTKNTKLAKYGDATFNNRVKAKQTRLVAYGQWNAPDTNTKREQTCLLKYGVANVNQCPAINAQMRKTRALNARKKFFIERILADPFVEPLFSLDQYLNDANDVLKWKCKQCGDVFDQARGEHQIHDPDAPKIVRCLKCFPFLGGSSGVEHKIADFVKSICLDEIQTNTRKIITPKELDIYIPSRKIAIECDGYYWHSENNGMSSNYHLQKTAECAAKGIQLLHIFDIEWTTNENIAKYLIEYFLFTDKENPQLVDYSVVLLSSGEAEQFFNANCIEGSISCTRTYGVKDLKTNDIVFAMNLMRKKLGMQFEWHIVQYCMKTGVFIRLPLAEIISSIAHAVQTNTIVIEVNRRFNFMRQQFLDAGCISLHNEPSMPLYATINSQVVPMRLSQFNVVMHKNIQKNADLKDLTANCIYRVWDCGVEKLIFAS